MVSDQDCYCHPKRVAFAGSSPVTWACSMLCSQADSFCSPVLWTGQLSHLHRPGPRAQRSELAAEAPAAQWLLPECGEALQQ